MARKWEHTLNDCTLRYDYVQNGICNIFMAVEPLVGKRHIKILDTRTKKEVLT